jgi:hypothetical protein
VQEKLEDGTQPEEEHGAPLEEETTLQEQEQRNKAYKTARLPKEEVMGLEETGTPKEMLVAEQTKSTYITDAIHDGGLGVDSIAQTSLQHNGPCGGPSEPHTEDKQK